MSMTWRRPGGPAATLAGVLLLTAACAGTTDAAGEPVSNPSTASPSPSPLCPSEDDVVAAIDDYLSEVDAGSGDGFQLSRRGVLACEAGYATAEVTYPLADPSIVVLHHTGTAWEVLIMGTDVCSGEGEDGRKRPRWMVGVPDSVVKAARCQPDFYRD